MSKKIKLWIVGQNKGFDKKSKVVAWEFQGVFTTKRKAIKACVDHTYFIGSAILNDIIPNESISWPDCYYPVKYNE